METDHKPLVPLLGSKNLDELPPWVQRLKMRLMRYSFSISHVPGKNIVTADVLSRAPERATGDKSLEKEIDLYAHQVMSCLPATEQRPQQIREHQDNDGVLKQVKQYCLHGWPGQHTISGQCSPYHQHAGDLTVDSGLLLKGTCIVIPKSLERRFGTTTHRSPGHREIQRKSKAVCMVARPEHTTATAGGGL